MTDSIHDNSNARYFSINSPLSATTVINYVWWIILPINTTRDALSNDAGNCLAASCIIYMTRCLSTAARSTYCKLKLFQRYNFHVRATLWVTTKFSMSIQCHVIVCLVRIVVSARWRDCDGLSRSRGRAAGMYNHVYYMYVQGTCTSTSIQVLTLNTTHFPRHEHAWIRLIHDVFLSHHGCFSHYTRAWPKQSTMTTYRREGQYRLIKVTSWQ